MHHLVIPFKNYCSRVKSRELPKPKLEITRPSTHRLLEQAARFRLPMHIPTGGRQLYPIVTQQVGGVFPDVIHF